MASHLEFLTDMTFVLCAIPDYCHKYMTKVPYGCLYYGQSAPLGDSQPTTSQRHIKGHT